MKSLVISTGEAILLDDEDFTWAANRSWSMRRVKLNGDYNTFVVAKSSHRTPIYSLMHFPFTIERKHLDFVNGNRLDYRKPNLAFSEPGPGPRNIPKYIPTKGIDSIEFNDQIIEACRDRNILVCSVCYHIHEKRYASCLTQAANHNWKGWKPKKGEWCKSLNSLIQTIDFNKKDPDIVNLVLRIYDKIGEK